MSDFDQNTPDADITALLLIVQRTSDEAIRFAITEEWVERRCAAVQKFAFRDYSRLNQMSLQADDSLEDYVASWTADRFAGRPAPATCGVAPTILAALDVCLELAPPPTELSRTGQGA